MIKDKLLQDPTVGIHLYFKYSKNTPWITSEELAHRVKQHIDGKN